MQNELKKQYVGVFDEWKIDLALGRIRTLGFAKSDWPDLMQELAIEMMGFRHDPAKANGATEETVFYEIINRTLLYQMRTRCRDAAKLDGYARELGVKADGTGEEPSCEFTTPLKMDVEDVCRGLSEFDQKVCKGLASGGTKVEIASELGCDWHTVKKAIKRIRAYFEARGLRDWVVR